MKKTILQKQNNNYDLFEKENFIKVIIEQNKGSKQKIKLKKFKNF